VPLLKRSTLLLLPILLAACQLGGSASHPVPTVSQIGSELKCAAGDHSTEDSIAGWGFCYPGTWKYNERQGNSITPPGGLDITFDIVNDPCPAPSSGPSPSAVPTCKDAGLFAFMIVSTFERGSSTSIADWVKANLNPQPKLQPTVWGNAVEAARASCTACPPAVPDGSRIALTPHHIVILDLHSAQGNLDLEAAMGSRLDTWKFLF
jgi:hypothetical protein